MRTSSHHITSSENLFSLGKLVGLALVFIAALPYYSESQDVYRPMVEEEDSKVTLQCGGESGTKKIQIKAGSSGDCRASLQRKINNLNPEQFFECEGQCEPGCECIPKFDTDCGNFSIGGQEPPGRCVYRNPMFPPLWRDDEGRPLEYDPNPLIIDGKKFWRCGFVIEMKGRCACVKIPVRDIAADYMTE